MCAARGLGVGVPGLSEASCNPAVTRMVWHNLLEDDRDRKQRQTLSVGLDMVLAAKSDPTSIGSTSKSSRISKRSALQTRFSRYLSRIHTIFRHENFYAISASRCLRTCWWGLWINEYLRSRFVNAAGTEFYRRSSPHPLCLRNPIGFEISWAVWHICAPVSLVDYTHHNPIYTTLAVRPSASR